MKNRSEMGTTMAKRKMTFTTVGGSSILTIFAVLCFIVFALLSLSTAKADNILSAKSIAAVDGYYRADTEAEEILARIRQGEMPEGVKKNGNCYSYACPVDDNQELWVEVEMKKDTYTIRKWQKVYTGQWETDSTIRVWGGATIDE